jgi:hypothetical protein
MADVGRFDVLDGESLHSLRAAPRLRRARVCKTIYKPLVFQGNFLFSCVRLYNCDWLDVMTSAANADKARKTFGQCAADFFNSKQAAWHNEKHREQWLRHLSRHCSALWDLPVADTDTGAVLVVLTPL